MESFFVRFFLVFGSVGDAEHHELTDETAEAPKDRQHEHDDEKGFSQRRIAVRALERVFANSGDDDDPLRDMCCVS